MEKFSEQIMDLSFPIKSYIFNKNLVLPNIIKFSVKPSEVAMEFNHLDGVFVTKFRWYV